MIFYLTSSRRFFNFLLVYEILGKEGVNLAIVALAGNGKNSPFEAEYLLNEKEIKKSPR